MRGVDGPISVALPAAAGRGRLARICVTGGLGFVGSHLCAALVERGYEVVCVDRQSGNYGPGCGPEAAARLSLLGARVIRADIARDRLDGPLAGVDAIVHLAALPGVRSGHGLARLFEENAGTTERLVNAAAVRGQRFLLASSSSVYGDPDRLPTPEHAPPSPLGRYAASKLAAERACLRAAGRLRGDVVIARLFTVFGPGQRPDMAFARWIASIASGRPIAWCAAPEARREFTYAGDAAAGLIAALERGMPGEIYNVAGSGSTPLRDALHLIEEMVGRPAVVRHLRPSSWEAVATAACGVKAARDLGYRPAFSLERGLERQLAAAVAGRDAISAIA
jgi:UDP-glucuronate 4-epimerase